jgi:hypothetical protein
VTTRYAAPMVFYTDGSLIDGCAGFAFHRAGKGGFDYKISSPAGVFTVELTALFVTLLHIGEIIQPSEKCLIFTDSLSSVKALVSTKILSFLKDSWSNITSDLRWLRPEVQLGNMTSLKKKNVQLCPTK